MSSKGVSVKHSNFVEIVGYQFERVHTGVVKWILDSDSPSVPMHEKFKVLERIYTMCEKTISFKADRSLL